jgi:hypothetical protein
MVALGKDVGRDNPPYLRGMVEPHWEMPLDRQIDPPPGVNQPTPRLFDLDADPAEQIDLAATWPEVLSALARTHDEWFAGVAMEWREARGHILEHDRAAWRGRPEPDPTRLFHDFWEWQTAPGGTDPATADPLTIFRGFWNDGEGDHGGEDT